MDDVKSKVLGLVLGKIEPTERVEPNEAKEQPKRILTDGWQKPNIKGLLTSGIAPATETKPAQQIMHAEPDIAEKRIQADLRRERREDAELYELAAYRLNMSVQAYDYVRGLEDRIARLEGRNG